MHYQGKLKLRSHNTSQQQKKKQKKQKTNKQAKFHLTIVQDTK